LKKLGGGDHSQTLNKITTFGSHTQTLNKLTTFGSRAGGESSQPLTLYHTCF